MRSVVQCCLSTAWGGLEMVAFETAARLHARGWRVRTLCPPGSPLAEAFESTGLPHALVRRGPKYLSPPTIRALRAEILRQPTDVVLVQQLKDLWHLVPALIGQTQTRLVGVAHTFVGLEKKDLLHRRLYARLDRLIALTPSHRANLLEHLPLREDQMEVIPNAVDVELFSPRHRSDELRRRYVGHEETLIGLVSRLDANKGLLEAVRAIAQARSQGARVAAVIFGRDTEGEGGMHARLSQEIATLGLESVVTLGGHIDAVNVAMASFDLFLMPSPKETFGRVLLEAMACGRPLIASRGGGVPDIVREGETGLLVPPGDVNAMADALVTLSRDVTLARRLAENGLRVARETYATDRVDARLRAVLEGPKTERGDRGRSERREE